MKILLSSLLIASNSFGYDFKLLKQGEAAPYEGLLFSVPSSRRLKQELLDLDKQKSINESLSTSISLYKKNQDLMVVQVEALKKDSDSLAEAVKASERNSTFNKILYFSIGALTSGLIVYAASR